jgi:hypothetical protein
MSREWRPIQIDLREPPALNAIGRRRVATILTFSQTPTNVLKIDYKNIITDENMRKVLKYQIPTGKVWYNQKGKTMVRKSGSEATPTLRANVSVACPEPKRSAKPKTDAPKSKVAKPTIISGAGDRTPTVSVHETVPQRNSIGSSGKELPTTSAPTAPLESATLAKDLAEKSGEEVTNASSEDRLARVDNDPISDVIEIDDEPEEPEREVPSVQNAAIRKGKEKVLGSTKRTRFALDPREYALTRANDAELLFGRPRFVLPIAPVTKEILGKPSLPDSDTLAVPFTGEPVDRSPVAETEARSDFGAGLIFEDRLLVEHKASLSPGCALRTHDHIETETANLLKPVQEGSNPTEAVVSPRTNRLGETSVSRPGVLIDSLREDLMACPLEAFNEVLPEGSLSVLGIGSQEELAEAVLYAQLQVSCPPNFSYPLFSISYPFFFFLKKKGIIRTVALS